MHFDAGRDAGRDCTPAVWSVRQRARAKGRQEEKLSDRDCATLMRPHVSTPRGHSSRYRSPVPPFSLPLVSVDCWPSSWHFCGQLKAFCCWLRWRLTLHNGPERCVVSVYVRVGEITENMRGTAGLGTVGVQSFVGPEGRFPANWGYLQVKF